MILPALSASTTKAAAVLALVFVSGFVSGLLTDNLLQTGMMSESALSLRQEPSLEDLSEHLDLNPVQTEQIRIILDDVIIEEADLLSEFQSHREEARVRIIRYLTPEQSKRFDDLMDAIEFMNAIAGAP